MSPGTIARLSEGNSTDRAMAISAGILRRRAIATCRLMAISGATGKTTSNSAGIAGAKPKQLIASYRDEIKGHLARSLAP